MFCLDNIQVVYTPTQRGNYHHMPRSCCNPTAAVNLISRRKTVSDVTASEAAGTHNMISRKIISNVKCSDTRHSLPTVVFVKVD